MDMLPFLFKRREFHAAEKRNSAVLLVLKKSPDFLHVLFLVTLENILLFLILFVAPSLLYQVCWCLGIQIWKAKIYCVTFWEQLAEPEDGKARAPLGILAAKGEVLHSWLHMSGDTVHDGDKNSDTTGTLT